MEAGSIHELPGLDAFLAKVYDTYQFDLRGYARASLARRLRLAMSRRGLADYAELGRVVLANSDAFGSFVDDLTIQVSELFRDPEFHKVFREQVVPVLRTYPLLRIWNAGCSTGEEAYSLAMLLEEEGLYERTQIYATDLSGRAITRAKQGMFSLRHVRRATANYQKAGGTASLSDYYTAGYDQLVMHESLRRNILFFRHDLVGDHVFGTMHVIFCRNVLIYFAKGLRAEVLGKLCASLSSRAFLCLGTSERLALPQEGQPLGPFAEEVRIYRALR
jgi:chemotaxis protein methyltransferase CheR